MVGLQRRGIGSIAGMNVVGGGGGRLLGWEMPRRNKYESTSFVGRPGPGLRIAPTAGVGAEGIEWMRMAEGVVREKAVTYGQGRCQSTL